VKFLDANIFLRYLTGDDEAKALACLQLFQRLEAGAEQAATCEAVLAEVVYVLSRGPGYRVAPGEIAARLRPVLGASGLKLPNKYVYLRALDLYTAYPTLDFEDVLAIAHMEHQRIDAIYSYDRDFDRVSEVTREEP
jgi:predicted nucleic acid-binding protein